jgi:UDP-MurNAc hydroxylase
VRIQFVGHAGFIVDGASETLIMDPWLSDAGAFDSAWFQFPCNHHLDGEVLSRAQDPARRCYLYVSHEHKDHLDVLFLERLVSHQPVLIVAAFQNQHFITSLRRLGFTDIICLNDGELLRLESMTAKIFIDDSGINRDSAILVKEGGYSFLNLNDCKIFDRLHQIRQTEGAINVLACQFSGATWHPTCYVYESEKYAAIAKQKFIGKLRAVHRALQTAAPDWYFPSAGPPCFLDPDLFHLNFEKVNIFPSQFVAIDFLRKSKVGCRTEALMPGDVFESEINDFSHRVEPRVTPASEKDCVRQYAARFEHLWNAQARARSDEAKEVILGRLSEELRRKLDRFAVEDSCGRNLYFSLSGLANRHVCVDFGRREVRRTEALPSDRLYHVEAPAWQVERVLDREMTWEDFCLTFRARVTRSPDQYDTLINGFLFNEAEAIPDLIAKISAFRNRKERIVVEVGGQQYEIDRYCPHQGADLRYGWCAGGRYWVCSRHGWKFNIENGGRCLTSADSIGALSMEAES